MKNLPLILSGLFVVVFLGIIFFVDTYKEAPESVNTSSNSQEVSDAKSSTEINERIGLRSSEESKKQLLYLIEEEKLAHDVYTVMFEKYGAKVFGNILESESTHQERVLELLVARNIDDPRSDELGVFTDASLQNFYNELIAQGMQNETEAFKAGVRIEERDIADITQQLATTTEQDVIDTLEDLRRGSENHLRAFNRQL
jgi:hypothetical protein